MRIVELCDGAVLASRPSHGIPAWTLWRAVESSVAATLLCWSLAAAQGGVFKGDIDLADHGPQTASWLAETVVQVRPVSAAGESANATAAGLKPATVNIRDGAFSPTVLPVARGSEVRFINQDKKIHNILSSSPTQKFDLGMLASGESGSVVFNHMGVVHVGCKAESAMEGYVVVVEGQRFAVGDERGLFEISGVSPGSYVAEAWNPHYEPVTQRVTIDRDGQVVTASLKFTKRRTVPWP